MSDTLSKEFNLKPQDVPRFPPTDESGEVDIWLIDTLLNLTPTQRLERHQAFIDFAACVRQQRVKEYGFDPADVCVAQEVE